MNDIRFDDWVRRLRSRRRALRMLAGVSLSLATPQAANAGVERCLGNGAKCAPSNAAACCTGACKKRNGAFKCAPAGAAFGCTKRLDECRANVQTACPDNPTGTACIGGTSSKPLCVTNVSQCASCRRDADCVGIFGPTARCITACAICQRIEGLTGACVLPASPPS